MRMAGTDPLRVVFFGDSICVGQGVSLYKGWVAQVAQELDELGAACNREIVVVNSSINGRITRQALEDMPYHVQSSGVDILIVQFGMNDCNYWQSDRGLPRVSKKAFVANLEEIVARGRRFGAEAVLLNNNHPTSRNSDVFPGTEMTYQDSNRAYNQAIRELADMMQARGDGVIFNDVERHFEHKMANGLRLDDCLLPDRLHLSLKGHQLYHEFLSPVIGSTVRDVLKGRGVRF